jgi:hypothetical protein
MWLKRLAALISLLAPPLADAQSIDISQARLRLGEPIALTLHVQAGDLPAGRRLAPECIDAEMDFGDTHLAARQLQIRTRPDGQTTQVTLSHPSELSEPIARVRVELLCGPAFAREFTIFGDPPLAGHQASQAPSPSSSRSKRRAHPPRVALQPAGPAPDTAPPLNESQLGAVAAAVMALLRTQPATSEAAGTPLGADMPTSPQPRLQAAHEAASPDLLRQSLLDELDRLHHEQGQTAEALNALLSRIDYQDRSQSMMALWLGGTVVLTLCLAWLGPASWRFLSQRLQQRQPIAPKPKPAVSWLDALPVASMVAPAARSEPHQADAAYPDRAASQHAGPAEYRLATQEHRTEPHLDPPDSMLETLDWPHPSPDTAARAQAWPSADFGQATLERGEFGHLLGDVDALMAQGYPGACAVMLEEALQHGPGKPPALLLRLLDIYQTLEQPWNHERVCAQIEALYNVQIPAMHSTDELDMGLEAMPDLLRVLTSVWRQPDCADALGQLLVRPCAVPAFNLATFKDLLLLQAVASDSTSEVTLAH